MVFRLPTPFDSSALPLNPSLASSAPSFSSQARPWRGTFNLHGVSLFHHPSGQQILYVTSAETDGDNRSELWPKHFNVYVTRQTCRLSDIQAYLRSQPKPLCMFMPDRLGGGGGMNVGPARENEANFRALSRTMMENHMIAIAPWNEPDRLPGSGILIFPTTSSTALLVGAIFLDEHFPDFILAADPLRQHAAIPTGLPSSSTTPFSQQMMFSSTTSSPTSYSPGGPHTPPSGGHSHGYHQSKEFKAAFTPSGVQRPSTPFRGGSVQTGWPIAVVEDDGASYGQGDANAMPSGAVSSIAWYQ